MGDGPLPLLRDAAVVSGYPAAVLSRVLIRAARDGAFASLPPEGRRLVLATVHAVDLAGIRWRERQYQIAADGNAETWIAEAAASSPPSEDVEVCEAADMLSVTERRVRQLAAAGLGRKVAGRWVLNRADVLAEVERRTP